MTGLLQRNSTNNDADTRPRKSRVRRQQNDTPAEGVEKRNHHDAGPCVDGVLQTLQSEIIPRLLQSCQNGTTAATDETGQEHSRADHQVSKQESVEVAEFATFLIKQDTQGAASFIEDLRQQGRSVEWLCLELLSPAAAHIGSLWEEDRCSIIDVTLGMGSLQQLLRELGPAFEEPDPQSDIRKRALFMPMPGEQHTFGLSVLTEFFRRAGWEPWSWPMIEDDDPVALVRQEWFAVIGISVSAKVNLAGLKALIQDLRQASGNPGLVVLVGGPLFLEDPLLAKEVGADATASDARQAVSQAESLLGMQ